MRRRKFHVWMNRIEVVQPYTIYANGVDIFEQRLEFFNGCFIYKRVVAAFEKGAWANFYECDAMKPWPIEL